MNPCLRSKAREVLAIFCFRKHHSQPHAVATGPLFFARFSGLTLVLLVSLLCQSKAVFAESLVREVYDGDTIVLQDGRTIRYLDVNAPEMASDMNPAQPFAREATHWNKNMVLGKTVRIEMDAETKDTFGRTLAYVYLPDGRMVNQAILAEGLAQYFPYRQNMKHGKLLLNAQRSAMQARKGLWQTWKDKPGTYIANSRSLRFHEPGCPFGRKTASRNRHVFHRMWDAFWEGYFPCKQCLPGRGLSPKS